MLKDNNWSNGFWWGVAVTVLAFMFRHSGSGSPF